MKKSLIPWHVFRDAIAGQDPAVLGPWLNRWGFTNDGVLLIGVGTYPHGLGLGVRDHESYRPNVASSAVQTSILRILLATGCLLTEEAIEPWSYDKEF